jgi:hypothetical protein
MSDFAYHRAQSHGPHGPAASRAGRRRRRYVDPALQKRLVAGLVVLESVLVAASVGVLYWHLNGLVEENLYRIHFTAARPLLPVLLRDALLLLGAFVVANMAVLLAVMHLWGRRVNSITDEFMLLLGKTRRLDFSADGPAQDNHQLLALTLNWRAKERARLAEIQEQVAKLEAEALGRNDPEAMRDILAALDRLVPVRRSDFQ